MDLTHSILTQMNLLTLFQSVDELPCHGYIYDTKGRVIHCNVAQANFIGANSPGDLVGISTYDLIAKKESTKVKLNDTNVRRLQKQILTAERFTFANNQKMLAISIKSPFRDEANRIIGIIGISIIKPDPVSSLMDDDEWKLTARQKDCLFYLVKGFSVKEISSALALSVRTVEHHFEHIKIKLKCVRRSDLISRALKISSIRNRFMVEF